MAPVTPGRLRQGDTVAVVSPSWGGPSRFPAIYELGLSVLREELGLRVREMPNARTDADWLALHPEARAADLTAALEDPEVRGIWCSIGGEDSMRLLPHLDSSLPLRHPKVLVGYSDSTTLLIWMRTHGVVSFHGPSIMAGIAQWRSLPPEFAEQLRSVLFEPDGGHQYRPFPWFSEGYENWGEPASIGTTKPHQPSEPWRWLNAPRRFEGELFGGNLETLDLLKGTRFFPFPEFFDGQVLFLETSEEHPPPKAVGASLRNYGVSGILGRLSGLLLARPRGYSAEERKELDDRVRAVVVDEFGLTDLPVVTGLDFGHTDPQWVLPLGGRVRLDPEGPTFTLTEPAVA
ncbi:MAG TPA: S66 peptidase family protein [Thermoplasmata archaeon]|nr:S66 peptidase family protein [Thermoplasmata archaeon]